jgi:ABC-type transport system substrate-binding protein
MLTPELPRLVLGVNKQGPTLVAASKIYQGLLKFSLTFEPLPERAKAWSVSEDRRTYTIELQPNVKWHDGKPFTAENVRFSIMEFHMRLAPRARGVFQRITDVKINNDHSISFTLNAPFEPFLLMFDVTNCAIVPAYIYKGTDFRNNPANTRPVGTGPFQFVDGNAATSSACAALTATGSPASPISMRSSTKSSSTASRAGWRSRPSRCSSARRTISSPSTSRSSRACRNSRS